MLPQSTAAPSGRSSAVRPLASLTLDELLDAWLDEAVTARSRGIYARTMRAFLRSAETIGLDALRGHTGVIAVAAAAWASATQDPERPASPLTIASRLSIIGSFYATLRRVNLLQVENPIALWDPRRRFQTRAAAEADGIEACEPLMEGP